MRVDPVFEKDGTFFFGFPFDFKEEYFEQPDEVLTNVITGFWLKIEVGKTYVKVTTDILGGYRVYYCNTGNGQVLISDDFIHLKGQLVNYTRNKYELQYWEKHGFTTGKGTFFKEILKVSPSSSLVINENSINEISYFKDISREPSIRFHVERVHEDLSNTISRLKKYDKQVVLLFSGGRDSCLLLQYLIHYNIPYEAVFLKMNPISRIGNQDLEKARVYAAQFDVKLNEIEIKLDRISQKEKLKIIADQVLDKHYSLLHFMGLKKIKEKYGSDIIILNGQSSDSILSFGPSENSIMSLFRRNIMYSSTSFFSKLGLILLMLKTRKAFRLARNTEDSLVALFDEYKYTRVIESSKSEDYLAYLSNYIIDKTKDLQSFHSKEMYTKILSFCQGSDNQVVVKSALENGLNVLMPFATPEIVYATIRYKNEKEEIYNPKYVIDHILKAKFNTEYKKEKNKRNRSLAENVEKDNKSVKSMELLYNDYIFNRILKDD